jgi:hypothetical protein
VTKTDFYWVFPDPDNPDVFTEIREARHAEMKRFTVGPYSPTAMQAYVPAIDDVEKELMEKLHTFAVVDRRPCDLGDWLHWFSFDVSSTLPSYTVVNLWSC